jgi:energy-converting hydrogenase Eha subunit C
MAIILMQKILQRIIPVIKIESLLINEVASAFYYLDCLKFLSILQ